MNLQGKKSTKHLPAGLLPDFKSDRPGWIVCCPACAKRWAPKTSFTNTPTCNIPVRALTFAVPLQNGLEFPFIKRLSRTFKTSTRWCYTKKEAPRDDSRSLIGAPPPVCCFHVPRTHTSPGGSDPFSSFPFCGADTMGSRSHKMAQFFFLLYFKSLKPGPLDDKRRSEWLVGCMQGRLIAERPALVYYMLETGLIDVTSPRGVRGRKKNGGDWGSTRSCLRST